MHQHLIHLITILRDHQYHDGTTIGKELGVSRTAVWKMIRKLQDYGIDIQSLKNRGYCLTHPLILLDKNKIIALCNNKNFTIEVLEKINSTNDYLKNKSNVDFVLCEIQTQGRGRFNRVWHSPFAQNIYFSMRYTFEKDLSALSGLSLVVSLAVCRAISDKAFCSEVKWPNDILINKKKLAGILIDVQAESNGFCNAIIGIGINVNMQSASSTKINQAWTSLQNETENYADRNLIAATLIDTLRDYLFRFSENGFGIFLEEWKTKDALRNHSIELIQGHKKFSGVYAGIDKNGCLLLKVDDNSVRAFSSGDVTSIPRLG